MNTDAHDAAAGAVMGESVPTAVSVLIEGAVAAFDADRGTARRYLLRASAMLRARRSAPGESEVARGAILRGGLAIWQVNRVVDHIEEHLGEKITGRELASLINISVGQLFRAFKVSVGVPPFRYLVTRRIEVACELLTTTREPLCQIAIASGLCDQAHFCRVFRRMMGVSPGVWRRANATAPKLGKPVRADVVKSLDPARSAQSPAWDVIRDERADALAIAVESPSCR